MSAGPPGGEEELLARARAQAGRTLGEVATSLGERLPEDQRRRKGQVGLLVEQLLGAKAGSRAGPDFPEIGVELKTIPLDPSGKPRESTFVCTIHFDRVSETEWRRSPVYQKLARVLFVPVESVPGLPLAARRIGTAFLWTPSPEEEATLRADWDEIVGRIGQGRIEDLSAHLGQALQVRPKAAHGRVRRRAPEEDGAFQLAMPRGFYLRARFTEGVVRRCLARD